MKTKKPMSIFVGATAIIAGSAPTVLTLNSCGCTHEKTLEEKYNAYAEKHQKDFINNLSYKYHDYYRGEDLFCSSEAEAVIMWSYGPGYHEWGTRLHKGEAEAMKTDTTIGKTTIGIPNKCLPRDLDSHIERFNMSFRHSDFVYLDQALSRSTAGEKIKVYHGYEYNEVEMMKAINEAIFGVGTDKNIMTLDPSQAKAIDINGKLQSKTITDLCWCATTFEASFAFDWANGYKESEGQKLYNIPVYELELDPNINCAYTSYSNKKWFDGIYLAWPHEYQLLTERGLNFKVKSAEWVNRPEGPDGKGNFLYIRCTVSK